VLRKVRLQRRKGLWLGGVGPTSREVKAAVQTSDSVMVVQDSWHWEMGLTGLWSSAALASKITWTGGNTTHAHAKSLQTTTSTSCIQPRRLIRGVARPAPIPNKPLAGRFTLREEIPVFFQNCKLLNNNTTERRSETAV